MDISISLQSEDFTVSSTNADVISPIFNSVSIDKTQAVAGDTINISASGSDDMSGVSLIDVFYLKPITGQDMKIGLHPINGDFSDKSMSLAHWRAVYGKYDSLRCMTTRGTIW